MSTRLHRLFTTRIMPCRFMGLKWSLLFRYNIPAVPIGYKITRLPSRRGCVFKSTLSSRRHVAAAHNLVFFYHSVARLNRAQIWEPCYAVAMSWVRAVTAQAGVGGKSCIGQSRHLASTRRVSRTRREETINRDSDICFRNGTH